MDSSLQNVIIKICSVKMLPVVIWIVMPCSLIDGNQHFRGIWRQHASLKCNHKTTWCHNPNKYYQHDYNLHVI
jgi:hypothetical protein